MREFDDVLLDIALKNLDSEINRFKDIDTKAIGIITIVGILVTFLFKENLGRLNGNLNLFLLPALAFLITILICVSVIRVKGVDVLSTHLLIEDFKDKKSEDKIKGLIATIAKAEKAMRDCCNQKAHQLKYAVFALGISIILLILYSLSTFLNCTII